MPRYHDGRTLSGRQMLTGAVAGAGLLGWSLWYGITEKPTTLELEKAALKNPATIGTLALCSAQLELESTQQALYPNSNLPGPTEYMQAARSADALHVVCTAPDDVIAVKVTVDAGTGSVTNSQLLPHYYQGK